MSHKVFISVKYDHDHILERSLCAYLQKEGYAVYSHKGKTDDIVQKAAQRGALPPSLDTFPIQMVVPSALRSSKPEPPASIELETLTRHLIEQVCSHELVIVIWSKPYSDSPWTLLEMKTALWTKKPVLALQTDQERLPSEVSDYPLCKIVDITPEYATSHVAELIGELLVADRETIPLSSSLLHQGIEFVTRHYQQHELVPPLSDEQIRRAQELVQRLRRADERGQLHDEIERLDRVKKLDDDFRKYLELVMGGKYEAQWENWYYTYLLGEILDIRFLNPVMPPKLRTFYEAKIGAALQSPNIVPKLEVLFETMVKECLFTREFIEYFGHLFGDMRRELGAWAANTYWEMCTDCANENGMV